MHELILLPLVGFAQACFTALVGFGGGAILMAALLMFMGPAEALPFHGMVQLCGNFTRFYLLWRHIAWHLVWRYALLIAPGGVLGMWVFQGLSERGIQVLIGSSILAMLILRELRFFRGRELPPWGFIPLGFVVGVLSVTVGVVAMFAGVFMIRKDLSNESINVTLGLFGALGHVVKIVAFGLVGFDFGKAMPSLLVMMPAVVLGTLLGRKLMDYVSERYFLLLFKATMVALCLKLVLWEGLIVYWL